MSEVPLYRRDGRCSDGGALAAISGGFILESTLVAWPGESMQGCLAHKKLLPLETLH